MPSMVGRCGGGAKPSPWPPSDGETVIRGAVERPTTGPDEPTPALNWGDATKLTLT